MYPAVFFIPHSDALFRIYLYVMAIFLVYLPLRRIFGVCPRPSTLLCVFFL